MKILASALLISLMASAQMASAASVVCPGLGTLLPNGDSVAITFTGDKKDQQAKEGFGDSDNASLVIQDAVETVVFSSHLYQYIHIPNALFDGSVKQGIVTLVSFDQKSQNSITCSAE